MSQLTETEFLQQVAQHHLIVIRDDGVNRHLRFKKPGTGCMHFDLITWPGYLAYTGDMGCYVFSRLEDMFEFFRTDREYNQSRGRKLGINTGYWAEKLQAIDKGDGLEEFDPEAFRRVINQYRTHWMRDLREQGKAKQDRRDLWDAVECQVLNRIDDGGGAAQQAAYDFHQVIGRRQFAFDDLFEHRFTQYTHRFLWCCYALAWGIEQYDDAKAATPSPAP